MRTVSLPNEELLPEVARFLSEGKEVTLKTKGNSMLPFIIGGEDSVILKKKDVFLVGDIVLAEIAPRQYVIHRILKVRNNTITLMGDGNIFGNETCDVNNICGHAIAIVHKGKQIDCNSRKERLKAYLWKMALPARRYLLAIYRRLI